MNIRNVVLLVLALGAAGFTAMFARNWISAERAAIMASVPKETPKTAAVEVLVAARALPAGTFITKDSLRWQAWPEDGVAEGYTVKGQREPKEFEGAVVRNAITEGEPLLDARVVHPGDRGFLAAVLKPGTRAVSVPIDATTGIAGFVFPGDWVDVVMTMKLRAKDDEGENENRFFSETLLGDVRVIAVDQKVERQNGEVALAKTATLEVSPKQAEMIALGLEMGSLSLSLHSLAREQDRFSVVAREVGADPEESALSRSYTMDVEVMYMHDALKRAPGAPATERKRQVNILRGQEAEQANF